MNIGWRTIVIPIATIFLLINSLSALAQPTWLPGTPSIIGTGPLTIDVEYGINTTGVVYIVVVNSNYPLPTSAQVKSAALTGPAGARTATAVLPVTAGQAGTILQTSLNVIDANRIHSVFLVAESSGGVLQAVPIKFLATTLPCPNIDILTGFSQPITCITQGPLKTFQVVLIDPATSGILKGTQWTMDWGDGSPITSYTSAADYDIPPLAMRQHLYNTTTSCYYVFTATVRNPCGETYSVQYNAIVHGRDIPADGNGILQIVNSATNSPVVQVCAGAQTVITLRDNSTWNCQTTIPEAQNNDSRNIEWLYGRNQAGTIFNTITGTVTIGGLGNAPQASGRMLPTPYGSTSLSQTITIPATAQPGQFFRVYLKNWNKCNPGDAEFVSTYVDIEVVPAPAAPTAPSRTICIGEDGTLSVTSVPAGTITWYSNATLTTPVGTGPSYTPPVTLSGTYTYYVTDREASGLLCQSPATAVTLIISPKPSQPTITFPNKNNICFGVDPPESYTITASVSATPPVTGFQWYRDGVALPGRTYDTIYITKPSETGRYTVRAVGAAPSYCLGDSSVGRTVTVHTLENVIPPRDTTICQNGTAIFHAETSMVIHSYAWEVSYNAGISYTTVGASAPHSGKNTETLTVTQPPLSYSGYWYRLEMMTPAGQGGCRFKSPPAVLTIDGLPTANAGTPIVRCTPNPLDPFPMTGASRGGSASTVVWSGGAGLGSWTQNMNPALATFTPSVPSGSFIATLTVTGTAACGGVIATGTRTISWSQTPIAVAGANLIRCDATPFAPFTMTGATATGTFSAQSWSGGAGLGTWMQNADPALAVFTPSVPSGSFTATLSLTGSGACTGSNAAATRLISWGQTPVVVAGPALSRCDLTPFAPFTMTGASSSGTFTGQVWSGGAGLGTWTQNANPALATFTPTSPSGSFTATISLTGAGACAGINVSDIRTIEWSHQATVSAGPDLSVCANASATLAGTIGGGATSAVWTGGTGTFNPNNTTLNAIYTPSEAEKAAQTVTLTLTTNDPDGICPAVSDAMIISIGTVPTFAVLTTSGDWCTGDGISWLNVNITGGAPPYRIRYRKNGVLQTDIYPYADSTNFSLGVLPVGNYIYQVFEIRDDCGNIFNTAPLPLSASFQVYQKPVANAGSDVGVCGSLSATLNAIPSIGTGSWSVVSGPGTISFMPDASSPSVTATASAYGSYTVRWTEVNGGICTSTSDVTISYERTAAAGVAQNLCGTLSAVMSANAAAAGTGTWTKVSGPGTVSFSPSVNNPASTATVSEYGTYVLRWTIANGIFCSSFSDVTLTFEKAADAGAEQHLCGTFSALLTGNTPALGTGTWSLVSGPGTASFTPTINTPAATATVTAYGSYVFNWKIDNGAFCSTNNNVTVVFNPAGQVNDIASQVLCHGDNSIEINFSTSNAGGSTTYNWTNSAPGIGLAASGSGDILSFIATNTGTAPVIANIQVTPYYSDGVVSCPGTPKNFTITVNPTAQVNPITDLVACNAVSTAIITLSTANTIGSTTYSWSNSDPGIGLPAAGMGNIPSFIPVNTGLVPVTATITVVPLFSYDGQSCTGTPESFQITVNPTGQVTQPSNIVLCNNSTGLVEFTTTNGGGTTTYSWTNTNTAIGLPASGNGDLSFTATNTTTAPITATIEVTPTYTDGGTSCPGPPKSFTITVNPTGQVVQPAPLNVCNGSTGTVSFSTLNTVGTTSYQWSNSNTDIGLGANGSGNISFIAINPGTSPITATITVTPSFNFGSVDCPGPSKTFTITVNPTPSLAGSLTPPDVCSNTTFNYSPSSLTAGTTFNWNRAVVAGITPVGPTSGTDNPAEILRNTTNIPIGVTYQYTLSANGCNNNQNVIVNVKPEPVIAPGQISDLCSGNTTNYHIALVNFTNPGDNVVFTWPAPVLSPVNAAFTGGAARLSASSANIDDIFSNTMGFSGTATYTVTPYKDGCPGTPETVVLTIRSQPVLSGALNRFVCSDLPIGLVLTEATGSVPADYYNIMSVTLESGLSANPGNAAISFSTAPANYLANDRYLNITGVNKTVTYRIQPVHAPDCFGTPVDVVVTVRPQPYIVPAQTKTVCSGVAIGKEILLGPANIPAGTRFSWPLPTISDFSVQGSAGVNVAADPSGTIHINDQINNTSGVPITATYYITPTSIDGCVGTTVPVVITINPEPLPKLITGRDKICVNEINVVYNVPAVAGSGFTWTVTPSVGTKTFDFNTNAIIINAAGVPGSGNITVFETNFYGCAGDPTVLPVQVFEQALPEGIAGLTEICANSTQVYSVTSRPGSIYNWSIPGGAAISGDPSSASVTVIFGNVGGTISVTETNIAGCVTVHTPLVVTVKPLPAAIISGGLTICDGGVAPLNVDFTGTGPFTFTYAINGIPQAPVTTSDDPYTLNVTSAGTYTILSVTDATGCTGPGFGSAFVTYHLKPTAAISGGAELCRGASTSLTVILSGTAPYNVTYTDGTSNFTVTNYPNAILTLTVTPLVTSTYTLVSVTDANGCSATLSGSALVTVNQPPVLTLTGTDITCYDFSTGAVDLSIAGSSPFGVAWTGPNSFVSNTEDITGLKAGTYNVTVTDTKGCTATGTITIAQPPPLNATIASTNILCFGAADATITLSDPSGGSGSYEYSIDGGATWQVSGNFINLGPGTYDLRMRDVTNPLCNRTLNGALVITSPDILSATVTSSVIVCNGANNGSITISTPAGGSGTYGYSIDGGATWQASGTYTSLPQGTYDVRIRDAVNTFCYIILDPALVITEPAPLAASYTSTNISCFNANNGTITIAAPSGGSGSYQYSINGGISWQASGSFSNLVPATYNVMIRDGANTICLLVLNAALELTQPPALVASLTKTNVTCWGAADGTITITGATGGYGTYEYTIDGGTTWQASNIFTGLAPGYRNVRIRDAASTGCSLTIDGNLLITEPAVLNATVTKTNITCFGANDGTITVTAPTGGYGTYEFSIDGGVTWQGSGNFTGLTNGSYDVRIRDASQTGCSIILNPAVVITEPAPLAATLNFTHVNCFGAANGTISVSGTTGGSGIYEYTLDGGSTWQGAGTWVNLSPAVYNVRVRDAVNTGCILILNGALTITQPDILAAVVAKSDVTCNGGIDGSVTISAPSGGLGTYGYSINGGATWQSSGLFTSLAAGTYNVRIRDEASPSCVIVLNPALLILQPAILTATVNSTAVSCFGGSDGTITVSSPGGGSGAYEYSADGGLTWQAGGLFTGLTAGYYGVQIRDAASISCVRVLNNSLGVPQPAPMSGVATPTMVTCNGGTDGTITISSPMGGSGSYEFSINGGGSWQAGNSFTGLTPGTYDVKMRDAVNTGCVITINAALVITQPDALNALISSTNITCNGASDGTITISSATGGYGSYDFSINGGASWQASGVFTNVAPATYTVMIRDRANPACSIVLNPALTLTQPALLSATVTAANVTCFGAANGSIIISGATGGYGTYSYSINGGVSWQSSGSFTNLSPGTYNVVIRDALNTACQVTIPPAIVITEPAVLNAAVAFTNVNCFGASDGTITISSPTGGYGTYEYSIDGGTSWSATGSFSGLAPGFYNVQIRDAANTGCRIILNSSLRITEPFVLGAVIFKTDITCNGSSDGTISLSGASGGSGSYEYSINGGGGWQASPAFTGLPAASYNVQIRDAGNTSCVIVLNAALVISEPAVLNATLSTLMVTCFGGADGRIMIETPTGGSGFYHYSIDGGVSWGGMGTFYNLMAGTYDVRIRDASAPACVITLNAALVVTQPGQLSATVSGSNVTCFGAADGTISITLPTGGSASYEYSINGGGSWHASGSFTGLPAGSYYILIRDAVATGCVRVLVSGYAITQPAVLSAMVTRTDVTCFGANDGTITIASPAGGYGTYEYSIDGGSSWQPGGNFTGLAPGTYNVQMRDAANTGCVAVLNPTLAISTPAQLNAIVNSTNITCNGISDGSITITSPTGGYGTFDYSVDGGATWQPGGSFTGLPPATYIVAIRDRANPACVIILNPALTLTEPAALAAVVASTNVTCFGAANGTITVSGATGGYGTYAYSINGGGSWQSSGLFTNLAPGTYNIMVRDALYAACQIAVGPPVVITEPAVLTASVASTNVTCYGASDGTITISSPLGGYGTYEYSVDGGATWVATGSFTGLAPGFYNVQIRDAANTGCRTILNSSLRISEPQVLSAFIFKTDITCNGSSDGTISLTGSSGGSGSYEYSINGGGAWQASASFTALSAGSYNVLIRDAAAPGCVIVLNAALQIIEPAVLNATVSTVMVTCNGASDGRIIIDTPTGGSGFYHYSIDGGISWGGMGMFFNLPAATYDVRIRDASAPACVIILNAALVVTQPDALTATVTGTNASCFGTADGTIDITAPLGGSGSYEYSINGGGSWHASGSFTGLPAGTYYIMIRDAAATGCIRVLASGFAVTQPAMLSAVVTKTDITCNGANDGTITIGSPSGGYGTYEFSIDNGATWQPTGFYNNLIPGTYSVRMRDAANIGCSVTLNPNLMIMEPMPLILVATGDITLDCFGETDGFGAFYSSGGTMPYTFTVVTNTTGGTVPAAGFASLSFFNAGAGQLTVTVTDSKGCSVTQTINITQPAPLTAGSIGSDQVVCFGQTPLQLTEVSAPSGGPAAYSYQWQYSSAVGGPFFTIAGANASQYTPPAGSSTTLYYRRMVTSGTCPAVFSNVVEIRVNPLPVAQLTGGAAICPGESSVLRVTMAAGTGPFELDIANHGTVTGYTSGSDIIVTPAGTTTYTVTRVRDANGCEVNAPAANITGSATVSVRELPSITLSPSSVTVCEYGTVTMTSAASGSGITYEWQVDDGSGFAAVTEGGLYYGTATNTLSIFGALRSMNGNVYRVLVSGCSVTQTSGSAVLTVNTAPEIQSQPVDTTVCTGANGSFAVVATGTGISYQWQVNIGGVFTNVVDGPNYLGATQPVLNILNAPASFNNRLYRVLITGSCGTPVSSSIASLRVHIAPVVTTQPLNRSVCAGGGPVGFLAYGSGLVDSLRWQVFDGVAWSDLYDNAIYSGTASQQLTLYNIPLSFNGYRYRLALKAKCTIVYSNEAILTVNGNPVVDFSAIDPIELCGGVSVVLNGNPSGGSGSYTQHRWQGDVGPLNVYTIQSPTFLTQMGGTYVLSYTVTDSNGCMATDTLAVQVERPVAMFIPSTTSGCTDLPVTFTNNSSGFASVLWDFGDGSTSTAISPAHTYVNTTTAVRYYEVVLTVTSAGGCTDVMRSSVTVYPVPVADFVTINDTICSGDVARFVAQPGGFQYHWVYGDGQEMFGDNLNNHTYFNSTQVPVSYDVKLVVSSYFGCSTEFSGKIVVYPKPLPQFTASPPLQVYPQATVSFNNLTNAGNWTYLWRFGDGNTSALENPVHTYAQSGDYSITLVVGNGICTDSVTSQIRILPTPPIASFEGVTQGCEPWTITPVNTSLYGSSYLWSFGDGGTSTVQNPVYTYRIGGTYTITLTVFGNGGVDTYSQVVEVYSTPLANFKFAPEMVYVNDQPVRFFNLSNGASHYIWDFADGDTSHVKDPTHIYKVKGIFDVILHAYSPHGCLNSFTITPGVIVESAGELQFPTAFRPNQGGPIDGPPTPTTMDMFFYPAVYEQVEPGTYKLQIFNRWGTLIFESRDINTGWNGYYKGKLVKQGVYVWLVEGKYTDGRPFRKAGDVTLLH